MLKLQSPAKINLTLDILGKDERVGKHFVNTILYRHDALFDKIALKPLQEDRNLLHCDYPGVPKRELNTVMQALDALGVKGWEITIKKQIPTQSGLGGGSSNAGTVLKHFAQQKRIPLDQLHDIAKEIGADVPFFLLEDNLAYAEGFGDQIVQSWTIDPLTLEIIQTGIQVPTQNAYSGLDLKQCGQGSVKTEAFLKLLNETGSVSAEQISSLAHNDFESSFLTEFPQWKNKGWLCGSGGTRWTFA